MDTVRARAPLRSHLLLHGLPELGDRLAGPCVLLDLGELLHLLAGGHVHADVQEPVAVNVNLLEPIEGTRAFRG